MWDLVWFDRKTTGVHDAWISYSDMTWKKGAVCKMGKWYSLHIAMVVLPYLIVFVSEFSWSNAGRKSLLKKWRHLCQGVIQSKLLPSKG